MTKHRSRLCPSAFRLWLYVVGLVLALQATLFTGAGSAQPCAGLMRTQTFQLLPGWNAIYLQVDPASNDPAVVFKDIPALSVWTRKSGISSAEFIENPNELKFNQPGWLSFIPSGREASFATTLFRIRGNRPYLVNLPGDAAPTTLSVTGTVVAPDLRWSPNAYTLIGMPVDDQLPPTFAAFFVGSTAHKNQPVYHLLSTGVWERIAAPTTTQIHAGEAYWVFTKGGSDYVGPIGIKLPSSDGFDYGRVVTEESLGISNLMSQQASVLLHTIGVDGAKPLSYFHVDQTTQRLLWVPLGSGATFPIDTGKQMSVRLGLQRGAMSGDQFCSILEVTNGVGGVRWMIPVAARSASSAPPSALSARAKRADVADSPFAGLWVGQVTINAVSQPQGGLRCASSGDHPFAACMTDDDCGTSKPCGNSSERRRCIEQSDNPLMACNTDKDCGTPHPCDPELNPNETDCGPLCVPVKRCADSGNHRLALCTSDGDCGTSTPCDLYEEAPRFEPVPTQQDQGGSTFSFRLLVHVDGSGHARLLKDVIQMFNRGTTKPDPDHPGFDTLDTPGHYVLVTDETKLSSFSGSTLRDGQLTGRRISSIAFDFPSDPQATVPNTLNMSGSFGSQAAAGDCTSSCPDCALCTTLTLAPNFAGNPFRHKYHPDHDNLNAFGQPIPTPAVGAAPTPFPTPSGSEEVFTIRRRIGLQFTPCEPTENKGCGDGSMVSGIYRETISGLHHNDIVTQGTFDLERIDLTAELNQ